MPKVDPEDFAQTTDRSIDWAARDIDPVVGQLHEDAHQFGIFVNSAVAKFWRDRDPLPFCGRALKELSGQMLAFHNAIMGACIGGYARCTAPSLRTMTELLLNALIILEVPTDQELRAFWHMYSFARRAISDPRASEPEKRDARAQLDAALRKLPAEHRAAARSFIFNDKPTGYWHGKVYARPSLACDALFNEEMAQVYNDLSSAAHGGYLGQSLFRSSEQSHPNPEPSAGQLALAVSTRLVLELFRLRQHIELADSLSEVYEWLIRRHYELAPRISALRIADREREP